MCLNAILETKFGRRQTDYGIGNEQKALNGFEPTVYMPTNWRPYEPHKGKLPQFQVYGATTAVAPEHYQRNYAGIFPIKQQPQVEERKPYESIRYS